MALFLIRVLADHSDLGIFVFEVSLQSHKVKVAGDKKNRVACGTSVNTLPERLDEKLITSLVCMLKGSHRWDSFESDHKLKLVSQFQRTVWLQSRKSDSTKDVMLAVLIKSGLHVDIAELLDHNVLTEELRVSLSAAQGLRADLAVRIDVFQPRDIVDLSQLLGLLIQRREDFFNMLHVLEYKGFSLVHHDVLYVSQEVSVD